MTARDDFPKPLIRKLALRVGYLCSNPDCQAATAGPQEDPLGAISLGVAAHITAASNGGPRYDPNLTPEQRCSIENAIWLCQNCAKLIDSDLTLYTERLIRAWKLIAEDRARSSLGKTASTTDNTHITLLPNLELYLEEQGISIGYYGQPVRWFVLGLKNVKGGTAKFPWIRFRHVSGLSVDHNGIDGNGAFGLGLSPSENAWVEFQGGADKVIHPGRTLKITRLHQTGEGRGLEGVDMTPRAGLWGPHGPLISRWAFSAIELEFEISAEATSIISGKRMIEADSKEWPTRI
jgi:hypothetical protein